MGSPSYGGGGAVNIDADAGGGGGVRGLKLMIDPGALQNAVCRVPGFDLVIDGDFEAGYGAVPKLMITLGFSSDNASVVVENFSDDPRESRH